MLNLRISYTFRSSHPEALAWAQLMTGKKGKVSKDEKLAAFKTAIKKQTQVMIENISGEGLDIPLLGIR